MAAPTNYVIKVYTSEQHAIEGGTTNALEIVAGSSGNENLIMTHGQDNYAYFTHERYYYRIECNDDIKAVYIDWGDGDDRDPKSAANYQVVEAKNNEQFVVVDHIFTDHNLFFPIIKAIDTHSFESKYYTASLGDTTGLQQVTTIACTAENANTTLGGKYFDLYVNDAYGEITPHRFFYDVGGGNTVTIPDGFTGTEITGVGASNTADQVATATETVIESVTGLTSTVSSSTITVTNSNDGNVPYPDAGTSGFTIAVTTYGAKNDFGTLDKNASTTPVDMTRWVQVDSATDRRIPAFAPSAVPPVSVLKVNRTEVKSGIDNDVVSSFTNPVGYVYMDGKDAYDANGNLSGYRSADADSAAGYVTVTYKDIAGRVISEDLKASTKVGGSTLAAAKFPADYNSSANYISEILEVRLNDLREGDASNLTRLFPKEKIHILIRGASTTNAVSPIADATVTTTLAACQVSLGNPIVTLDSVESRVIADGSESYSRHSNEEIKSYYFDTSKFTDADTVTNPSSIASQGTDVLVVNEQDTPVKNISYTFDYLRHDQTDVHNRFYPTEKLIRLQVESDSNDNRMNDNDAYYLSHIDSWSQIYDGTDAQHPESLRSRSLLTFFTEAGGADEWTDMATINRNNTGSVFGDGDDNSVDSLKSATPLGFGADNYLLMVDKYNKFNRLYYLFDNQVKSSSTTYSSVETSDSNQAKISFLYSTTDGWKPLKVRDHTITKNDDITKHKSLTTSGSVTFDMPVDWEKVDHQDVEITPKSTLIGDEQTDDGDSDTPEDIWTFTGYALLMAIDISGDTHNPFIQCKRVNRFDNSFSQLIKVVDPMHISINSVGVSQGISYNRKGTYVSLDDRLGRRELKRIGANGGSIKFGGIDISGDSNRDTIITHQKNGNPVYYDFERPDGSFIRFYGIITSVSEDLPVGLQHPKFGINMDIEYIIEFSSTGTWVRKESLGGDIADEPTYV